MVRGRRPIASLDITPLVAAGRQIIQAYGQGRFRIAGEIHAGSVIVRSERTAAWPVTAPEAVTIASLESALDGIEIVLVGCGPRFVPAPAPLRTALKARGIALEWMDTGAACRTFNVLLVEERRVAAALIAIE